MTRDIKLDSSGDLPEVGRYVEGAELVRQRVELRLGLHVGEWLTDRDAGMPWLDWSQVKPPPLADIRAKIRSEIGAVPGVVEVTALSVDYDPSTRTLRATGRAIVQADATRETIAIDIGIPLGNLSVGAGIRAMGGGGVMA